MDNKISIVVYDPKTSSLTIRFTDGTRLGYKGNIANTIFNKFKQTK